jgi:CelD/BcsL family acetyltransferase involved in cellulose biosynthesis
MRLESHERIEPIAREWDDLADRTNAVPWLRPGWIAAWWKAFGAGRLKVLCVRRDGSLAGLVSLYRRAGGLHSTTNAHTPEFGLLAEDREVADELIHALLGGSRRRVSLSFLDSAKPDVGQCRAAAASAGYRLVESTRARSPYLQMRGDWATFEKTLSRNLRQDVRRRRKKLDEIGRVSVEFCDGRDRLDELLDEGFRVEASGWKGVRGTAIISRPDTRRFYTEIAHWAAGRGWLQLMFLRLDGRPIAFQLDLACQSTVYFLKSGYDPAYRHFAPGKLAMYATVEHAFPLASRFEFLGADEPYKLTWSKSCCEKLLLEAFPPTVAGFIEWGAVAYGRPIAKRVLKRHPRMGPLEAASL